ncbi:MAG: Gfo/Idh/MocA family oxidoreductase [Planctomycetaceae bacterium]
MSAVRFAILGTARIARTIAPKLHAAPTAELVGVASRSLDKAEAFASEFSIPKTYASYQAALDDPSIDAVYIPLPPSLHPEWVMKAAAAGKHILCEKPLATNVSEVDQMIAVCQAHDVVLLDGVMWYHTQRAAAIQQKAASGDLGSLKQITSAFTFHWDTLPMENLRLHRDLGGGALLDLGWYCVGAAVWLFGELPHEVFARATWHNDVDTRINGFLWFDNDRVATLEAGFDAVRRRWLEVTGTRKTLFCDDFTRPWNADQSQFRTLDGDGQQETFSAPAQAQEVCMIEAFCQLIDHRRTQHPWLTLSRRTQLVCDALQQSAREQRTVTVPRETEPLQVAFVDDSAGNRNSWKAAMQLICRDNAVLHCFESESDVRRCLDQGFRPDVFFVDYFLERHYGTDVIALLKQRFGDDVVMIAHSSVRSGNQSLLRGGAHAAIDKRPGGGPSPAVLEHFPDFAAFQRFVQQHRKS